MDQTAEIIAAVKARDTERVRALLEQEPRLATTPTPEGSLLLTAVYHGAGEAAELIRSARGDLTLFEAAAAGDTGRLAVLLDADPNLVNAYSHDGLTPLGLAAFFGHREAAALLLDRGAEVNAFSCPTSPYIPRNTALHCALAGRRNGVAIMLAGRGADVNAVDSNGDTPLKLATQNGDQEAVACLLSRGARAS